MLAAELEMEYVAVSFPRDARDMDLARKLLRDAESQPGWWPRSNAPRPWPMKRLSMA